MDSRQNNPSYEDNSLLDLEIEGLKQRIDYNIKRHMDIRWEIRTEVDKLRQENMDLAAMLHRTDETFYLHRDFSEEVNRLRLMNVRLKAMMCLQDVKSIEASGSAKSHSTCARYGQQRTSHSSSTTSHGTERDTYTSGKSRDMFDRIDKLEAEMKSFLGENALPKKKERYQPKHVSEVGMHCSAERLTSNIRDLSADDKYIFVPTGDVKTLTRLRKNGRTKCCNADTNTEAYQCKSQLTHSFLSDKTNTNTNSYRSIDENAKFNDTNMLIINYPRPTDEHASSDDRDVNMNSSRSDDRSVVFDNRDMMITNSSMSKDERVISGDRDTNMNSSRKLECMLVMVHPERSQSGTIVGFDVAEPFGGTTLDNDQPLHHRKVIPVHYEPAQPVCQKGVSDLVPSYVESLISVEDFEIRDIYKNTSNESDIDHRITSSKRPLRFATPYKVVSTRHARPRDVPRLDLGDLVSESDVNIVRVTQETVTDLLSDPDPDQFSSVSYLDLSDDSGCQQHWENENMSAEDVQHQVQKYSNEECHYINDVNAISGQYSCKANKDQHIRCDHPGNFSHRRVHLSNMIKTLCAEKELSDMPYDNAAGLEQEVSNNDTLEEECAFEWTNICKNSMWNNTLNATSNLFPSVSQTKLEEEARQVNTRDVDGSDINADENPVMPTDGEEDRYAHYVELCNTTMRLTSIIKDICASRNNLNEQEFPQHLSPHEEPCLPELWFNRDDVKVEPANQLVRSKTIPQHNMVSLSPSYTDVVKIDKNNFPWMFPRDEEQDNNVTKESENRDRAIIKERSPLHMTIPFRTMDSARSDVSCIDLSLHEETTSLGSTRREVQAYFQAYGYPQGVTNRTELSSDGMDTDRLIASREFALSCKRRQLLSTSLSESHEDIVRLLNLTTAAWEDPELEVTDNENSVQEIWKPSDSSVGSSRRTQAWKPLMSEYIPNDDEQTDPVIPPSNTKHNNMESARHGYDADCDISCIDMIDETTRISSDRKGPMVKSTEFLRHERDEMETQDVFYRDLTAHCSTSSTSTDENTAFTDTEETDSLYVTASGDDSVLDGLTSPDSLAGYARRDEMWEQDFVINYMSRSCKEQTDKEVTKHVLSQANEDIDRIHAIRIPLLLAEEDKHEIKGDMLISDHDASGIFEAMDSARSDVSCIELRDEEPTLRDIKEGHVIKEFLTSEEDNHITTDIGSDVGETGRWAVPTKLTTHERAASGSSSDDHVVISDIENDNDGNDMTSNYVTSAQAFTDADSCVFDMNAPDACLATRDENGQSDHRPPDVSSNTCPILPSDDTHLHLDIDINECVVPRMSDLQKHGPRVTFDVLRGLNVKLEKVKRDLMDSSRISKWLTP